MTEFQPLRRRSINWAVVLLVVGIVIRFGLWIRLSQNPSLLIQGDGVGYEAIARNVLEGHGFSMEGAAPYTPDMLRTPGYPALIIAVYALNGYRPELVTLLQNIFTLITIYFGYRLAVSIFDRHAALIAAVLMAGDMGAIIVANVTLTEALFMVCFVPATYCLFCGIKSDRRWTWWIAAGGLFGLATLDRPAGQYLPLLLILFVWFALKQPRREKLLRVAALTAVYVLALTPWSLRNYATFGSPNLSLAQPMTLSIHAMYLRASLNHTTLAEEDIKFSQEVASTLGGQQLNAAQLNDIYQAKAVQEISKHLLQYALLYAKGAGLMLILPNTNFLANALGILDRPTGLIADMRNRSLSENLQAFADFSVRYLTGSPDQALFASALVIEMIVLAITYVFAIGGGVVAFRQGYRVEVVFLLVIIFYFFLVTGPIGTGRYRLPAMPYLMIPAGYGIVRFQAWRQARRRRTPHAYSPHL